MYSPRLNQERLLWILDELYMGHEWPKDELDKLNEADEEVFRGRRVFDIDALDPDKSIEMNPSTKQITNPITFSLGNRPTEDGLLSEAIFGITKEERAGIYGYIDLHDHFIHPFYYKIWNGLDKNLRGCIYETHTYRIDNNGYLVPDPNGESGLKWLYDNRKRLGFKNTKKTIPLNALLKARDADKLFVTKQIVIPPFYRDVDTRKGGRVGIGEINKLYVLLLNYVRGLEETSSYGMDILGGTKGKIQDILMNIYNWFSNGETEKGAEHTGSGIFRKFGIMRRTMMGKTTDYAARLVLSAPNINVEKREDLLVDMEYCSAPLAAVMACAYPFMIFHLNRYFNARFSGTRMYKIINAATGRPVGHPLRNINIEFSDDRFDSEMNEFIHGTSNRLKRVMVPLADMPDVPLRFKGFLAEHVNAPDGANIEPTGRYIIDRDMTWLDVFFVCAHEAVKNRMALITRYPMDSFYNHLINKIHIASTKNTMPMIINGVYYKWYPKINQEDIGSDTSNKFIDAISIANPFCKLMGADYDGDQVSLKILFSDEANDELRKYVDSKSQFIQLDGTNGRNPTNEALQAMYNLGFALPEDYTKLTKNIEFA